MNGGGVVFLEQTLHSGELHVTVGGQTFVLDGAKDGAKVSLYSYVREAVIRYRGLQINGEERDVLHAGIMTWRYVPAHSSPVMTSVLVVHLGHRAQSLLTRR